MLIHSDIQEIDAFLALTARSQLARINPNKRSVRNETCLDVNVYSLVAKGWREGLDVICDVCCLSSTQIPRFPWDISLWHNERSYYP